jgi:hypothetical protein
MKGAPAGALFIRCRRAEAARLVQNSDAWGEGTASLPCYTRSGIIAHCVGRVYPMGFLRS